MTEQFPMSNFEYHVPNDADFPQGQYHLSPGDHDVLLGRGGGTNSHPGNVKFRELVKNHKKRYLAATKMDKPKVAKEVVDLWRQLDPPGRFLTPSSEPPKGPRSPRDGPKVWVEVDEKEARKKASQCLRERTDDVKEYLEQLREQQDQQTNEGLSQVREKIRQSQGLDASTPDSTGSSVTAKARNRRSPPPTEDTILRMPDRPNSMTAASMRRTSMPTTAQSATHGTAGGGKFRTQDRRTSMPAGGQKLQMDRPIDYDLLLANYREVIRDAYTAVERSSTLSPTGMPGLNLQQQLMLQEKDLSPLSNLMTVPFPHNGLYGMGPPMSPTMSTQEQLMQQQRFLAQQQQHIRREQERLVRQEHVIAQMALQQARSGDNLGAEQLKPPQVYPEVNISNASSMAHYGDIHSSPTRGLPSLKEEGSASLKRSSPDRRSNAAGLPGTHSPATTKVSTKSSFKKSSEDSKPMAARQPDYNQDNAAEDHPEYRKTLENYIANNQESLASLDLHDESFDHSGTINGVEADEWIAEQVFNTSDMSVSNRGSLRRDRTVARTKSNKSVDMMSLATGTLGSLGGGDQMSFAFFEMDQYSVELEDLSKGERESSRRPTTKRSMSSMSVGTAVSELSDFDLHDDLEVAVVWCCPL